MLFVLFFQYGFILKMLVCWEKAADCKVKKSLKRMCIISEERRRNS